MDNHMLVRDSLIEAIPQKVHELMEASARLGPEPWLELDLTMKQLKVLLVLSALGPSRPSVIAASIGASAANATGVLDRLVGQGYIERSPDAADRRALLIRLTDTGAKIVSELHMADQDRLRMPLVEMSDDDLRALHQGLSALVDATQRITSTAPVEGLTPTVPAGGEG
jgi:DNA-binding MarR family transcriptional regulator